jgi:molybdopterin converting factor small subunit
VGDSGDKEGVRNLHALINLLGERFGAQFKEFLLGDDTCFFLVNGSGIMTTGGLNTPLHAGDKVDILPFVPGG